MKPELFHLPFVGWPVRGYGLMIVVGFLITTWLATREARRRGLPEIVYDLGVVMLLSGLVGGRVFYYAQFYQEEFATRSWLEFFAIWKGGLVFYGGAIGGALGGFLFLLARRAPIPDILDACAPYIPIAMGFGRLGCFLNGCCYGGRCSPTFPLAVRYPVGDSGVGPGAYQLHLDRGLIPPGAEYSLPVYPVQLFETAQDFLLFGLLLWYLRGPSPRGGGLPLLFVLYGLGRFNMEWLRGDNAQVWLGLTISQVFSLGLVVAFLPIFIYLWKREIRVPPRVHGAADAARA